MSAIKWDDLFVLSLRGNRGSRENFRLFGENVSRSLSLWPETPGSSSAEKEVICRAGARRSQTAFAFKDGYNI